jgi:DNA polymerase
MKMKNTEKFTLSERLGALHTRWSGCRRCQLCNHRKNVVWCRGNPETKLLIIGEAPGDHEDEMGKPFVGASGKLLDELFKKATGKSLERVALITNIVACRPPANRVPEIEEVKACRDRLYEIVQIVSPKIILLVGSTAAKRLAGIYPIGHWRGKLVDADIRDSILKSITLPAIPTYHPSYLLRMGRRADIVDVVVGDIERVWKEIV